MLKNIPAEYKSSAIRLLQFLVYTKRPLTLAEAIEVIATEIDQEPRGFDVDGRLSLKADVLRYCPSLVIIAKVTNYTETVEELHLAHFSVKEYLLEQAQFDLESASIVITRTCLTYLGDIENNCSIIRSDFPMARYAAKSWMDYAALAETSEEIEADRLAKEGTKMLMGNPSISATYAAAKRKIRETRDRHFRDWWQEALPRHRSYHALDLKTATLKCPRELSLPRGTLHHLLACRSTHGDFQSYHRRFNHKDATKCTCGRIKTPEHLVFCRKVQRLRSQWPQLKKEPQNNREYWSELIRQPERFAAFLEITRFYEKICPNARTTQTQSRTSESRPRTSQPMETQEQASPS
ncbi:hypothetical protein FoTM2_004819 [Fusarium oxysporum f. sp. vasinfectum]|nr:hypothetical protein FoTM2_004819 [Fusarium oxysporum f. sp. vasinfectum]